MARSRLSHEDAMTLWRARDIYRVQAVLKGLVLLFFVVEFFGYCAVGYWWLGRWAHQGLWWCIDHAQLAVQTWWREHRR